MKTSKTIVAGAVVMVAGMASSLAAQTPADFGYRSTSSPEGIRPLLTIMVSFAEPDAQFIMPYGKDRYETLLFGAPNGTAPNAFGSGGFLHTNSNFRFRYENAGILGPYPARNDPATNGDEARWRCLVGGTEPNCSDAHFRDNALIDAHNEIDLRRFDKNGDSTISADELAVLVIEAVPLTEDALGGVRRRALVQLWGPPSTATTGVRPLMADVDVSHWRSTGDIETAIHEVTHQLDIPDQYGSDFMVNRDLAMMSSVNKVKDGRHSANLDPYSKIRLGWLEPTLVSVRSTSRVTITTSNLIGDIRDRAVILFDDERRHSNEFFVLEYRNRRSRRSIAGGGIELHGFKSGSKRMATARPSMNAVPGVTFHDRGRTFHYVRSEGRVLPNPIAGQTIPLYEGTMSADGDATLTTQTQELVAAGNTQPLNLVGHIYSPAVSGPPGTVSLYRWRRPNTNEFHVTSDPRWSNRNATIEGFRFDRTLGYVLWAPDINYDADPFGSGETTVDDDGLAIWHVKIDPNNKVPIDISTPPTTADVPLSAWFHPGRNDTFTTTTWRGSPDPAHVDYRYGGELGRIHTKKGFWGVRRPLYHWWNEGTTDNLSTTDPAWAPPQNGQTKEGYRYVGTLGFVSVTSTTKDTIPIYLSRAGGRSTLSTNPSNGTLQGYVMPPLLDKAMYIVPVVGPEGRPSGSPRQVFWKQGQTATLQWFDGTPAARVLVQRFNINEPTLTVSVSPP